MPNAETAAAMVRDAPVGTWVRPTEDYDDYYPYLKEDSGEWFEIGEPSPGCGLENCCPPTDGRQLAVEYDVAYYLINGMMEMHYPEPSDKMIKRLEAYDAH